MNNDKKQEQANPPKSSEKGDKKEKDAGETKGTTPSPQKQTRVLVSEEQHLKNQARLKQLLRGTTLNVGITPEILALGIQEATYYLEVLRTSWRRMVDVLEYPR